MKVEEYIAQYHAAKFPENDWLHPIRNLAITSLEELCFPTVKDENWKYTRASLFLKDDFALPTKTNEINNKKIIPSILTTGELLVFVDGCYISELSQMKFSANLQQALTNNLVKTYLTKIADNTVSGFTALNTAMMKDGAFIHIVGTQDKPIQILHINTGKKIINHVRNLIIADKNSQATIIESYISLDKNNKYFNNIVNEIYLDKNAHIQLCKIQNENTFAQHISSTYVTQKRDSNFNHINIDIGSQITRNWLQSNLTEENAHSDFNGLYLVNSQQHIDNHTRIEHNSPHTTSNERYKGILREQCQAIFNGQVYIAKHAQKSLALQQNANLLLSHQAEIDTKPQLEIYADDVKCSHGATIGQLDSEALFYLQSRGLDYVTAYNILTYSFGKEIIDSINYQPLATYLTKQLLNWLPNSGKLIDYYE